MEPIGVRTRVGPDRTLKLPDEGTDQLREDQEVQVILLLPDVDEGEAWTRLAADQLLRQYADEDSVYDDIDLSAR